MTPALTALCQLDGAPLAMSSRRALGLDCGQDGFAGTVHDIQLPEQASRFACGGRITLLLGLPQGLTEPATRHGNPAAVMRDLLDRHGTELPARVTGEWALLDWQPGRLTLVQSFNRRDWVLFSRGGNCIAVGADIQRLAGLEWVGLELDPLGLVGAFGRNALRAAVGQRTVLAGVERLAPGETVVFEPGGTRRSQAHLSEAAPWQGSFADAVIAARELLDEILRERLLRARAPGLLLSGGLDSATLAALIAGIVPGDRLLALTSIAPAGSGLGDERDEAAAVVERLGLRHALVAPDPALSVYRPDPETFRLAGGPSISPRHYLYRALSEKAAEMGIDALFDGVYGELTLTSYAPLATLRHRSRQLIKRLVRRDHRDMAGSPFHVRLAPHRLAALAPEVAALTHQHWESPARLTPGQRWGRISGYTKAWEPITQLGHGLRAELPFRDPRLIQLFAGFPADFAVQQGLNRAPARVMMAGLLPESIRLRRSSAPFSPDYMQRIGAHAPLALARMPVFHAAEADDWVDLPWLERTLQRIAVRGTGSVGEAFEVQLTAMAAEFLVWWRGFD